MSFTVYMLIGGSNKTVYVGQSTNVERRLGEHWRDRFRYPELGGKTKREATIRVELVECADRYDMDATEILFIGRRAPQLNILHSPHPDAVRRREQIRAAQGGKALCDFARAQRGDIDAISRLGRRGYSVPARRAVVPGNRNGDPPPGTAAHSQQCSPPTAAPPEATSLLTFKHRPPTRWVRNTDCGARR